MELRARAEAVLGGGASSPVRAGARVGGLPFYQSGGHGAIAVGADGREYIDFLLGYGPMLFGYRLPGAERLAAALLAGPIFGSTHAAEIALAERIRGHLPSMERIRFATTGTEAVMGAVRTARAHTRRSKIVRFSGNYHGHSDFALLDAGASAQTSDAAAAGIPEGVAADIYILPYNDATAVEEFFARDKGEVAAILLEPVVGNMGLVEPVDGFLERAIAAARKAGALVIFDEVITWLRLGLRGAQGRANIMPDLTTIGKILGGGLPIAAFGGRADVMASLAPSGAVFTGGTHAGNPLAVAAGHAVLDEIEHSPYMYSGMRALAAQLADGLRAVFLRFGCEFAVSTDESIVDFKFRSGPPVRNYREAAEADAALFRAYYHKMRERGILLAPSQNEVMFLCTEHTAEHIETTIAAAGAVFAELF